MLCFYDFCMFSVCQRKWFVATLAEAYVGWLRQYRIWHPNTRAVDRNGSSGSVTQLWVVVSCFQELAFFSVYIILHHCHTIVGCISFCWRMAMTIACQYLLLVFGSMKIALAPGRTAPKDLEGSLETEMGTGKSRSIQISDLSLSCDWKKDTVRWW